MADPPFAGAVQDTTAETFLAVAETPVGASGIVLGVTAADGLLVTLVPLAPFALTVKVYAVPFVSPVTVAVVVVLVGVVTDAPPGEAVTV
jgi:hypothetical protein